MCNTECVDFYYVQTVYHVLSVFMNKQKLR